MIRQILGNCVECEKKELCQKVGDLPKERIRIGEKPFSNTGVDYFGPYLAKKIEKQDQLKL